ncbi:uncharacterized protein LOC141914947 [Tubulanus polymorphus]|uniref:uncharacterized protein LOC141914947 n=1 Tax=Tubulanus polymorphus TaxID=672921 RepID=UPI003DA49233
MNNLYHILVVFACILYFSEAAVIEDHKNLKKNRFTESELKRLARMSVSELPTALRKLVDRHRRSGNDNNWCCKNKEKVKMIEMYRLVQVPVNKTVQLRVGYRTCGDIGNKRCSIYDVAYLIEMQEITENFLVPDKKACKDENLVCCDGFIHVAGNCLDTETVVDDELTESLKILKDLDLLS